MGNGSLENALAKAGLKVGVREFLALVEEAARKLSPAHTDPTHYFSPGQRTALTEVGLDLAAHADGEPDPRARAVAAHTVLAESALTVAGAARALDIDDSRIRHRLKEGKLSGWKGHGGWRLPAWQFSGSDVLPGLDAVLDAAPDDQPALVVAAFMNTPQTDLVIDGRQATPREWLLAGGDPGPVARMAETLGTPP